MRREEQRSGGEIIVEEGMDGNGIGVLNRMREEKRGTEKVRG